MSKKTKRDEEGMGKLLFLHVGKPEEKNWNGKAVESAIGKKGVTEAFLSTLALEGDGVAATEFHGGPDRAVCFYPVEHYSLWESEFGKPMQSPSFGENISAEGMEESKVYIGDIYRLGNATVQVSQGRIPCSKISMNNDINKLLKRVVETGFTGYFFRVLEEGMVFADSEITLLERKQDAFSILEANRIYFSPKKDFEAIAKLLEVNELADAWKVQLSKFLLQKN
jgi:MOSC domain-containing protein YiiM